MRISAEPIPSGVDGCSRGRILSETSARWQVGLSRGEVFAGLSTLGFANGIAARLREGVVNEGAAGALLGTFGISVLVWITFYACPALMFRAPREPLTRGDIAVGTCALAAFMFPVSLLSWIALTAVALQILRHSSPPSPLHRGAWILLATTGAMFWGHFFLFAMSDLVLQVDASLVSALTGTPRVGNTVQFSDGAGYVWIETPCSSVHNVSLAILCWVLFAQYRDVRWSAANAVWCLVTCLSVIGVNVARIALMALHREHFDLLHGIAGGTAANCLTMAAMVAICAYGTRHGHLAHE